MSAGDTVTVPLPEDRMVVAVAPYRTSNTCVTTFQLL